MLKRTHHNVTALSADLLDLADFSAFAVFSAFACLADLAPAVTRDRIEKRTAAGGISDERGFLRMTSTIYKTKEPGLNLENNNRYVWGGPLVFNIGGSRGYCPAEGEETEVHLVVRDHGPVTGNKLDQITMFTDPSCAAREGSNLCLDIGYVAFQGDVLTKDIGHFPMFPPDCSTPQSEFGCSAEEEAIQLSAGMGNQVTFIRTGDAVQVVAEITLPKI